jgi:hypothetical protein
MNLIKGEIYYQCSECKKSHGMIRGAYEGATCPVHGKALHRSGTMEEIYRDTFRVTEKG